MPPNDNNVIEQYKKLPQTLKVALFSDDTTEAIFDIGKKNNLTVEQMGTLADETGLIILGITRPEDYAKNVAARLLTNPTATNNIVQEINEKIFGPIRDDLKKLHLPVAEPAPTVAAPAAIKKEALPPAPARSMAEIKPKEALPAPPVPTPVKMPAPAIPAAATPPASTLVKIPAPMMVPLGPAPAAPMKPTPVSDIKPAPPMAKIVTPSPMPQPEIKITPPLPPVSPKPITDIKPPPTFFARPIVSPPAQPSRSDGPATPPVSTAVEPPARRIVNWSDIPATPPKEPVALDAAKSELEKALNPSYAKALEGEPSTAVKPTTPPSPQQYTGGKDPYREPIE